MKFRRIISLLLLAVYLVMAVGPAVRSLSCKCVAMSVHACHTHHHCDSGCRAHACELSDAGCGASTASVAAPCCDDRHSTEIELYTGSSESERHLRCVVTLLPASLAAECPCPALFALHRRPVLPPVPCAADAAVGAFGLRAPPVLV